MTVKDLGETPSSFEKLFPNMNGLWHTLGSSWNYEDDWNREKCEKIIQLAKQALTEIQEYNSKL